MKLKTTLAESSTEKWAANREFLDAQELVIDAAIDKLEASLEAALKAHFPDFKFEKTNQLQTRLLSKGTFTLYGEVCKTDFSTTSATLIGTVHGGFKVIATTVEGFVDRVYEKVKDQLTKEILNRLNPSDASFRADYLKLQQDFVDRDLEVEIDHVPDQKTVLTVKSEDKKLPPFKVKVK
jgi:predicted oxidoreductase